MTLHEDIQKTIQEHLPKLQSDAVLVRLNQADEFERQNTELNNSLKLSSEANVKLRNEVESLKENAAEHSKLVSLKKELDSRELELRHKSYVLDVISAERDKHDTRTHELLLTLFKNTTVRKQTAQAISIPHFSSDYNSNTNRTEYQQTGASADVVPIEETQTEE